MNFRCRIKTLIGTLYLRIKYPKISFELIETPSKLKKMYELIWEVYGKEKKYIDSRSSSLKILIDEYEKNSIKIGAFNRDELIGTLRIILNYFRGFYVEKDFNIDLSKFSKNEMAELSRLVIKNNYRNKLISLGLLKKAFDISKKRGIKYWIVVMPKKMKEYYARFFGIKFKSLEVKELTEEQIKVREKMKNYYITCNPAPYLIKLAEI